jgi:hypothetical protein
VNLRVPLSSTVPAVVTLGVYYACTLGVLLYYALTGGLS